MLAVRYLTLMALVVWLGGLVTLRLVAAPSELLQQFEFIGYACGIIILFGLLVLKFMGPPPHGFIPRIALVTAMLAVAIASGYWQLASTAPKTVEIVVGLALLFWYVRE